MQVRSILGRNSFPGSPLFCKYRQYSGLVGILLNDDSGNDAGNRIFIGILEFKITDDKDIT